MRGYSALKLKTHLTKQFAMQIDQRVWLVFRFLKTHFVLRLVFFVGLISFQINRNQLNLRSEATAISRSLYVQLNYFQFNLGGAS